MLAHPYGGSWEQRREPADELGVVLLDVATGSCSSVLLPRQEPETLAALLDWGSGSVPWLAIVHVPQGDPVQPVSWAWAARGGLLVSLEAPFDAENTSFAQIAATAPAGTMVALTTSCLYRSWSPGLWLWRPECGTTCHTALVSSSAHSSPSRSCAFSPCSTLLPCHLGSCVVTLGVQSLQIVQHIPDVPGPSLACLWSVTGAVVLVEAHQPGSIACSGIHLLSCCDSGLEVGKYLSPAANKLHSGACAWTDTGDHLAVQTATARNNELVSDPELTFINYASAGAVSIRLDGKPYWLDWLLGDSAVLLSSESGQRHLVLSFS